MAREPEESGRREPLARPASVRGGLRGAAASRAGPPPHGVPTVRRGWDGRRPGPFPGDGCCTPSARLRDGESPRGLGSSNLLPAAAPTPGVSVPTGSLNRWALAPAVSATAAQSSSSLTKKARSTGAGEGDEAGARAHPRAEPPRAPRSRARGPNRALHWRGPRWGLGVPPSSVPRSRGGKVIGDSPLTRKGTRHDHGQPAKSSACILGKLSEDDGGALCRLFTTSLRAWQTPACQI